MRAILALIILMFAAVAAAGDAFAQAPLKAQTPEEIAAVLVERSRAAYHASGKPCACPDDSMRNGRRCGAHSAYSRPGGARPYCYVSDVPAAEIARFNSRI